MFEGNVDFVVGAQYGDEGKGMVAKLLADRAEERGEPYDWTARVGAQNAEHRFIHGGCDLCARILPSASAFRGRDGHWPLDALLGAGHCFRPEQLLQEAVHLGVPISRIWVDPMAMWLHMEHAVSNRERADKRGSTGWGIGAALAEKVARSPETKLMRDNTELAAVLEGQLTRLPPLMTGRFSGPGLFESSQGFMLSLNHGRYPYSTGKDVTVGNMCSELGLAHQRIRDVWGVVRLVFMRVPGPSGPTGGTEISYDEVEARTGLRFPHHRRLQGDASRWAATTDGDMGTTGEERLFDLSLDELLVSHAVNGYTKLAVTFTDMHRPGNYRVTRWADLHKETQDLICEIEAALDVPVRLVRTGQGEGDNIWLPEEIR